jgi:hypothetical protein
MYSLRHLSQNRSRVMIAEFFMSPPAVAPAARPEGRRFATGSGGVRQTAQQRRSMPERKSILFGQRICKILKSNRLFMTLSQLMRTPTI